MKKSNKVEASGFMFLVMIAMIVQFLPFILIGLGIAVLVAFIFGK